MLRSLHRATITGALITVAFAASTIAQRGPQEPPMVEEGATEREAVMRRGDSGGL